MTRAIQSPAPECEGATLEAAEFERCLCAVLPALSRYAWSLARDRDSAEDLVQETSLRAWRARARFTPGTNFKAWCYRILKNCFLSSMRWQKIARTDSRGDDMPDAPVEPSQEKVIELQDIGKAWERLTPVHQRSLNLVAIDGLSYEDAALAEGVPLGTMKSRVTRARQALAALMSSHDDPVIRQRAPMGKAEPETGTMSSPPQPTSAELDRLQVQMLRAWRERRIAAYSLPLAA
ncbi:sigma-70 family RNA polymerase sigma factor [uncultured Sphingomonas sp.]|uniref:sigma-70 family RNA polymerase sigma factor n=1 Tax=uncultured Sphingomonas sp. TaxID=158754 RepID=UPI0025DB6434|nr:sigma-70 family RNA polymerase sigma factor [uncultured Sphingomonas sp.]